MRAWWLTLLLVACDNGETTIEDRQLTLVIEKEAVEKFVEPAPTAEPIFEPELPDALPARRKAARPPRQTGSLDEARSKRNRTIALMYSVGLLPGDWPELDGRMRQSVKQMEEGDNAGAVQTLNEAMRQLESFKLTKPLLNAKLKRAERSMGSTDRVELASIAELVNAGRLELANERLNRLFNSRE